MQLHIRHVKRRSQMNWSIVSNHKIYIFPKAPNVWLTLGCSGVKSAPNCKTYLKMAALSTCCLEACQTTRQKPPLLLKRSLILSWPCHVRETVWRASRCQKTHVGEPSTVGIDLLLHSFGNCSVIKAAGSFWASTEIHVFATTGQSVSGIEGLERTSKEQWRLFFQSTNRGKLTGETVWWCSRRG